jgi:hypothetical protein
VTPACLLRLLLLLLLPSPRLLLALVAGLMRLEQGHFLLPLLLLLLGIPLLLHAMALLL